ncbi:hypothetical protein ACI8AC_13965 [Geodermatophilus sp. SYSU D00758]
MEGEPRAGGRGTAGITGNDQPGVHRLLRSYRDVDSELVGAGPHVEARTAAEWAARFDPAEVVRRRAALQGRGRARTGS